MAVEDTVRAVGSDRPLSYLEVLDDEYWSLESSPPSPQSVALRAAFVKAQAEDAPDLADKQQQFRNDLMERLHQARRSGICFSGGGIRSATFGLGVLQALASTSAAGAARTSPFGQLDYMSTVSGGGYLGAWFSAWATRLSQDTQRKRHAGPGLDLHDGPAKVIETLATAFPADFEPEPPPVRHLREYSNYLTPKIGVTSGDTWAATGAVLRNLFLNWLVLIPLAAALLLVPVGAEAALHHQPHPTLLWAMVIAGFASGALATAYIGYDLPSAGNGGNRAAWFAWLGLGPLVFAAVSINTFWKLLPPGDASAAWWDVVGLGSTGLRWWHFGLFGALMHAGGMLIGILAAMIRLRRPAPLTGLYASGAAAATGLAGGGLAFLLTHGAPGSASAIEVSRALYACVAFPLVMGVFLFAGTLLVGLTSYITEDKDREWWARAGGLALMVTIAWPAFSAVVLYAPDILSRLSVSVAQLAAGVGLTGWSVARLGSTSQRPATERERPPVTRATLPSWARDVLARLTLPIFVVLLAMLLALGNGQLLGVDLPQRSTTVPAVLLLGVAYLLVSIVASFFINVNSFSLHAMYRQRLIRCYLGASNASRAPHPFSGFDENDNLPMYALTRHRPLHVVNMALNLVGGNRLAWQHRKAESFTSTRLHSGSWCTGYRSSAEYGGKYRVPSPISLGTAMTISGAAASPNMGYHSSPLLTLVMTLFNARLGWWLGNPKNQHGLWRYPGPRFGVRPFIDEALGLTSDDNAWIYLSDGGHFDNLGLYEMVLRRCHTIVVSDAGADGRYTYEDLGNAVRKIRVDLGVSIEFESAMPSSPLDPPAPGRPPVRCALARIVYSAVEPGAPNGTLVYLKPSLSGDEPADVQHYAAHDPAFPHQTTTDQFFDEAQFESYRRLGAHIVESIAQTALPAPAPGEPALSGLASFVARARRAASGIAPLSRLEGVPQPPRPVFPPAEPTLVVEMLAEHETEDRRLPT